MYENGKATIAIERYDHLMAIEKAAKEKKMFLKDYNWNGQEFYCFTDVQKDLFNKTESLLNEIHEMEKKHHKEIQSLKENQSFTQKLKNLFK